MSAKAGSQDVAADASAKPTLRTDISDTPWEPQALDRAAKVIYGTDDRIDVYQETDPLRLQLAASTCGLLDASDLTNNGNGTFTLQTYAFTVGGQPPCLGEPFATQPVVTWCSGFLIGEDLVATAGHCYDSGDLTPTRFIFGFKMTNGSTLSTTINANQVYQGVSIVGRQLVGDYDYAVIKLDRKVTYPGAAPLAVRRTGSAPVGTSVGVIGHPSGLPMKIAFGPTTQVRGDSSPGYFVANLDTYGGNSGSPVFDQATGLVEGILVRGATDYVFSGGCFTSNQILDTQLGEDVSKSTSFSTLFPGLSFDKTSYYAGDTITVYVEDANAVPSTLQVTVTTSGGDTETVTVTDGDNNNSYSGTLSTVGGNTVNPSNGVLEVTSGVTLSASYLDADSGSGSAVTHTAPALLDYTASADSEWLTFE